MQNRQAIFIENSDELNNFIPELDSVSNVVVQVAVIDSKFLEAIRSLRSANNNQTLTLLISYQDVPFAKKLVKAGCIDNFYLLPIDADEMAAIINNPILPEMPQVSESLEQKYRSLEPLAYTDSMTDLYNRSFIDIFLQRVDYQKTGFDINLSLLLFDIDNLKYYNDTYGHNAGDILLKNTAEAMRKSFRPQDIVARIGGDEFAVILWDIPSNGVEMLAEERRKVSYMNPSPEQVAARFRSVMAKGQTTISGSVTNFKNTITNLTDVLEDADKKLYEAKKAGKNIILE